MEGNTMKRKTEPFFTNYRLNQRRRKSLRGWVIFLLFYTVTLSLYDVDAAETKNLGMLETQIQQQPSIESLIEYAYQENPSIQVTREAWQATLENYRIETGLPDPELMVTYYPEPLETRLGPQDWNANISQKIPFPGKLFKAGEIVETEARIAKLNLDKTVRDIIVSIRESFYELIYIRKAKQVANQNMKLLEHLRKESSGISATTQTRVIAQPARAFQVGNESV